VGLSDQLAKLDPFVEGLVRHVAHYIADILGPEDLPRLHENLLVGPGNNKGSTVSYVSVYKDFKATVSSLSITVIRYCTLINKLPPP